MTTVYRVENQLGEGPYTAGAALMNMASRHTDSKHPTPYLDGLSQNGSFYSINEHEFCGFKDEASLYEWFEHWEDELNQRGFTVAVYIVPENCVRYGSRQLVFEKSKASLLSRAALKIKEYA